jgi:hypothetical protein
MDSKEVRFPQYKSLELNASVKTKWEEFLHINFNDRAAFLNEPKPTSEYVPGVLNFFGALTTFSPAKETGWKNQKSIYAALLLITQFASDCCIILGYRLLMSCILHAFDSRVQSFNNKLAKLIVHQGSHQHGGIYTQMLGAKGAIHASCREVANRRRV